MSKVLRLQIFPLWGKSAKRGQLRISRTKAPSRSAEPANSKQSPNYAQLLLAAALTLLPASAADAACDRACLNGLADRYVQAMVAKAPASLPWAGTVRFSEDGVPMMVGDALWGSITAARAPALRAADPSSGQVAWFGVVEEHGEPTFLALRLKVENGRIAEAETQIRRKGGPAPYGDPAAYEPEPAFPRELGKRQRVSRARLRAAVQGYFDGKAAPGCARRDNGAPVASCALSGAVSRVRARAFPVLDEARGVVVATGLMDYPSRKPGTIKYPESLAFMAAFKLSAGRVERIEMIYTPVPYLMPSPWTR